MWSRIVMLALGIWLMVAPGLFNFSKDIANNGYIAGPLIATFSIIAMWECTRNVRLLNLPVAVWLFAAPFVLQYRNDGALMNEYLVAIAVIFLCAVKPPRIHTFGGGWPSIWKTGTSHSIKAANP